MSIAFSVNVSLKPDRHVIGAWTLHECIPSLLQMKQNLNLSILHCFITFSFNYLQTVSLNLCKPMNTFYYTTAGNFLFVFGDNNVIIISPSIALLLSLPIEKVIFTDFAFLQFGTVVFGQFEFNILQHTASL